jgi:RNase H-fold protein (predicted Holliday junction resolvase)
VSELNKSVGLTLLAIDPGRAKCGLAVVCEPDTPHEAPVCLERRVVETGRLTLAVGEILRKRPEIARFLLGNATHSATLRKALTAQFSHMPLEIVNEFNTSVRARARYVQENPAPGWRRLLPPGMRSPEVPYDDYAALLLAEDYFSQSLKNK